MFNGFAGIVFQTKVLDTTHPLRMELKKSAIIEKIAAHFQRYGAEWYHPPSP
ncbi:hypothetical protein [Mucilaginibacter phyllosphaerae]